MFKKLKNLKYLLKNNLFYKIRKIIKPYNKIKIREMPNEWYDLDHKMFLILKQLFIDFIEFEKPFSYFLSDEMFNNKRFQDIDKMQQFINDLKRSQYEPAVEFEEYKNQLQDMLDLYKWFKIEHDIKKDSIYKSIPLSYYEEQENLYEEETQKLLQLIAMRKKLWT